MNEIKKNFHHLHVIANAKPTLRKAILKNANKDVIDALCSCLYNFMKGNIKTNKNVLKRAQKYKNTLRKVLKPTNIAKKQEILIQKGGFLPFLIPAILEGVVNLFKK